LVKKRSNHRGSEGTEPHHIYPEIKYLIKYIYDITKYYLKLKEFNYIKYVILSFFIQNPWGGGWALCPLSLCG